MHLSKTDYKNSINPYEYSPLFKAKLPQAAQRKLSDKSLKIASAALGAIGVASVAISSAKKEKSVNNIEIPEEIKDYVKVNLRSHIGRETFISVKNNFINSDEDLNGYVKYKTKRILKDYSELSKDKINYIEKLVKEILVERISNSDPQDEFLDIPLLKENKKSTKFMNLFFSKEIFEVFLGKGLNAVQITEFLNSSTATIFLRLNEYNLKTTKQMRNEEVLNPELEKKVIELHEQGVAKKLIAENLNVSYEVIKRISKKYDLKSHKQLLVEKISPELVESVINMYKNGARIADIAKEKDLPVPTISNILKNNNISTNRGIVLSDIKDQVIELYHEGLNMNQIARKIGCSRNSVMKILQAEGLKTKQQEHNELFVQKRELILELYNNETKDVNTIAKKIGYTYDQVYSVLYNAGVLDVKNAKVNIEEENTLKQMVNDGASIREIAEALRISENKVYRKLKILGLETRAQKRNNQISSDKIESEILEMYRSGLNLTEIAKHMDCSITHVRNILNRNGEIEKAQKSKRNYIEEQVLELFSQGIQPSQIAPILKLNYKIVMEILQEKGLESAHQKRIRKNAGQEIDEKIKELHNMGYSKRQIAQYLDCSLDTVYRRFGKLGLKSERQKSMESFNKELKPKIEEMVKSGASYSDIAKDLNISLVRLYKIIKLPITNIEYKSKLMYEQLSNDELKKELLEIYFSSEEIASNEDLSELIQDLDEQKEFSVELRESVVEFIKQLNKLKEGSISTEKILESENVNTIYGILDKIEQEKLNNLVVFEELQNSFNNLINRSSGVNHRLCKILCKYIPYSLDDKNIENAKQILNTYEEVCGKDINKFEKHILYWDLKNNTKDSGLLSQAETFAENSNGEIDTEKAGQYILNAQILKDLNEVNPYGSFLDVIRGENLPENLAVINLIRLENLFETNDLNEMKLADFCKEFDPKTNIDSKIIKEFITQYYINNDTKSIAKAQNGTKIPASIKASAKQDIYKEYGYPVCLEYLTLFENALNYLAPPKGKYGIKAVDSPAYKMELKIMGYPNRLVSSGNDYNFDIHKKDGLHSKKDL